jgi:hypothetical protein
MSAKRTSGLIPVGLGFRAGRGGAVFVAVALEKGAPRVVLSSFLTTGAEGDRLSLEPYRVAAEIVESGQRGAAAKAAAAVAEGRKRQDDLAAKGLGEVVGKLAAAGCVPAVMALLVNRAGWITDLLSYSLGAPEHVPVAEHLAVRDALRFAFKKRRADAVEMDEKSLIEVAAKGLRLKADGIEERLKALGATAGKPWRKEQKLACLAAWVAVAAR